MTGETMSPTISIEPRNEPSQFAPRTEGGGGTTSATGLPKRVTRIGFLVLRTCSSKARHCALNFEMAISAMMTPPKTRYCTIVKQSGQKGKGAKKRTRFGQARRIGVRRDGRASLALAVNMDDRTRRLHFTGITRSLPAATLFSEAPLISGVRAGQRTSDRLGSRRRKARSGLRGLRRISLTASSSSLMARSLCPTLIRAPKISTCARARVVAHGSRECSVPALVASLAWRRFRARAGHRPCDARACRLPRARSGLENPKAQA